MSVDTIGDFLTIIRNGVKASKKNVIMPYSKLKQQVVEILQEEGFIKSFSVTSDKDVEAKKFLKVDLKYVDGESVIHEIERMSKPGRRMYSGIDNISPVIGGLGISILTTNKGVLSHKKARKMLVGGEIICTVW